MPQASKELRDEWGGPSGVADSPALDYLEGHGFKILRDGRIVPPSVGHKLTEKESSAIRFLCQEWDYAYSTTNIPEK